MNCKDAQALIAQGDLPGEHLSSCAQCRGYAEEIALLGKALSAMEIAAPNMPVPMAPLKAPTRPLMLIAAAIAVLFALAVAYQVFSGLFQQYQSGSGPGTRKQIMKPGGKNYGAPPGSVPTKR